MKRLKSIQTDQRGLAAVVITIFILAILSLVVLAFSQIARREQRQALDRQLSTQAFYVAESGVNDADKYVRANPLPTEKTKCSDPPTFNATLDSQGAMKETCVLFDRAPTDLEYSAIDTYRGEVISLKTIAGNPPQTLKLEWHDTDGGSNFTGCASAASASLLNFPTKAAYSIPANPCDAGMLKLIFMPVYNGSITREQLVDDSFSLYVRPTKDALSNTATYAKHASGANSQGYVSPAQCNGANGVCTATISNLPTGASELFLRISSVYSDSATKINGTDAAGNSVRFTEAQVKIDSTGKAADVLRRIQVRKSIKPPTESPPGSLEIMNGICKRLDVYPGFADNSDCGGIN